MKPIRTHIAVLAAAACALSVLVSGGPAHAAGPKKTKMDMPTLSCAGSTQASINLRVTAGATGAPAGFSIQWMTADAFAKGPDGIPNTADDSTWPASESGLLCHASFSGNASLSRYNLGPNESITVNVGEFLFDSGASTNCPDALTCGTEYVFRAFVHANSTLNRSDFTGNLRCSTLSCGSGEGCTYTQGYWKTHGPVPVGGNEYNWPQAVKDNGLTLGSVSYTADQLLAIFNTPASGNGLIALAHQLIAAKLNLANGASAPQEVLDAIASADALIGGLVVPPVGAGSLPSSVTSALITTLTSYNEGAIGPGHCE